MSAAVLRAPLRFLRDLCVNPRNFQLSKPSYGLTWASIDGANILFSEKDGGFGPNAGTQKA